MALLPATHRSFGPVKINTLMLACLRLPFAWLPLYWNLGFEIAGTLLVIYGFYLEPFWVDSHTEWFTSGKLKSNQSLKIIHIGDLHIERFTRREKEILEKIRSIQPDVILFSGDILNLSCLEDALAIKDAIRFFGDLAAPLGVFGVSGSPAVDSPEVFRKVCDQTPMRWLQNEVLRLDTPAGKVVLMGVTCTHNPDADDDTLQQILENNRASADVFSILLYHSPDLAPHAAQHAIDLQLCGHTHGGQIRLPFFGALYAGSLYGKAFEAGRYLVNKLTLYVTRGMGMEGAIAPRVRFLCRPEITLWRLQSASLDLSQNDK